MKFSFALVAALFFPVLVNAIIIDVQVGDDGLNYDPPDIVASPGDIVVFHFALFSHSVTQGSSNDSCDPLSGGFDSELQTSPATFNVTISDKNPIYFHCKKDGHCSLGMRGTINASPTANTFDTNPVMGGVGQKPL